MAPRLLSTVFLSAAVQVVWSTDSVNTSSYTQLYFGILFVRGCCWQLQTYCTRTARNSVRVPQNNRAASLPLCLFVCFYFQYDKILKIRARGTTIRPVTPEVT
jgi:hypothetical protein